MTTRVPAEHRADIAAYVAMKEQRGIEIYSDPMLWIEIVVINTDLDVAGTLDRLATLPGRDLPMILDVKTGHGAIEYGQVEIAAQLSVYARASHWWNGTLHPMPPVDQELALVAWMPAGEGRCELWEVDITAGESIARMCDGVRGWRKAKPLLPYEPVDTLLPERVAWVQQRVRTLPPPARVEAGKLWPDGIPRKADLLTSHEQVDTIAAMLGELEAKHGLPFGDPDPCSEPAEPSGIVAAPGPAQRPDPRQENISWAEKGRVLLDLLHDDDLARACADVAGCADVRMTELHYEALQAVVSQVADPAGAVRANWPGPCIELMPQAAEIMALGAARAAGAETATKQLGLDAARRLAKRHGLPAPKSLAQAAETPLLAALVANGTQTEPS